MKVLMISADGFEDSELLFPYYRLHEENIQVDVVSMKSGTIKGKHGYEVEIIKTLDEVVPDDYDMLILPGGKAPEKVRREKRALELAKHFMEAQKPVSAICHGPQVLITAGLLKGRHVTCYRTVRKEMEDAGALYEDTEVVIDNNLVTSRQPSDLPYFMKETLKKIRQPAGR